MEQAAVRRWLADHDPLAVVPLVDPVVELVGHDPRSSFAEMTGAVGISVWGECLSVGASLRWCRR